jgi:sn-glycerol 3-phosphate transport system permease protein|tara:strand:- start:417 stop:1304 length:888 start_codon:yes stop_codon:yes gene_type:complete
MIKRVIFKNQRLPYLLILPELLIILVFFYWPSIQAIFWSLTLEPPFGGPAQWVGLDNFRELLDSEEYYSSAGVTLLFAFWTTLISMGSALILALFVDRVIRGLVAYRAILMWPYAIAAPAVAVAFQFIFQPGVGFFAFLNDIWPGIWDPSIDSYDALVMVIIAASWKSITYNFIFFLAGLQSIPKTFVEAAALDGADPIQRFFTIVFPLLSPTFFFLLVINVTDSFTEGFGIINVMTQGGPGGSTNILVYKLYQDGFIGLDLSSSSAQSVILMVLVILLTFIQFRWIERRIHYAE